MGTSGSSHLRAPRGGSFYYEPLVHRHYGNRRVGRWGSHAGRDGTADGASVAIGIAVGGTGRADVGLAEPVACGGHGASFAIGIAVGGTGRADVGFAEPLARGGVSASFTVGIAVGGTGRADVRFAEPLARCGASTSFAVGIAVSGTGRADVGLAESIACGGRLGTARSSGISEPYADVDDASLTQPKESHSRIARSAVRFGSLDCAAVSITCG